jgi:hypothetical protein
MSLENWTWLAFAGGMALGGLAGSLVAALRAGRASRSSGLVSRLETIESRLQEACDDQRTMQARLEEAVARLEITRGGAVAIPSTPVSSQRSSGHARLTDADQASSKPILPQVRFDLPESALSRKPTLIAIPSLVGTSGDEAPMVAEAMNRRYAAIWELADNGASAETIARATGQPIGEIDVILGLRRTIQPVRTP